MKNSLWDIASNWKTVDNSDVWYFKEEFRKQINLVNDIYFRCAMVPCLLGKAITIRTRDGNNDILTSDYILTNSDEGDAEAHITYNEDSDEEDIIDVYISNIKVIEVV